MIVGPDEQGREVFNLRDLATRQERKAIPWADLETAVAGALRQPWEGRATSSTCR